MTSINTTDRTVRPSCSKSQTLEQRLACLADAGPEAIETRLAELDREWSAGRVSQATLGVMIAVGFALAAILGPWWLVLPVLGGGILLQYFFSRTSWLGELFQQLGYRLGTEIEHEKTALKVLRGDFRQLPTIFDIENHDDISRLEGEGGIFLESDTAKVQPIEAAKSAVEATAKS
ncbi:MAG TPA: hypothetical protein VLM40_08075 [Gemmata sp.]|nr:hypothetical protein [Gemmata sp.]